MVNSFTFSHGSCMGIVSDQDIFLSQLKPFINEVWRETKNNACFRNAILTAINNHDYVRNYFCFDHDKIDKTFSLEEKFFFPKDNPLQYLYFINRYSHKKIQLRINSTDLLPKIKDVIHYFSKGIVSKDINLSNFEEPLYFLIKNLFDYNIISNKKPETHYFLQSSLTGVFRLQHASILYRTKTTGILVDPHFNSSYELTVNNLYSNIFFSDLHGKVDAILISHYHGDHWHLPTIMMFPSETPIIVPKVPQSSIICDNMQQRLKSLGFKNVIAVDWYSDPIMIGDIEINILPFYGEQPLAHEVPRSENARNWGNTYLIRTEYYTSWFLIDSGNDFWGRMVDVANYVHLKYGSIDILLSGLREFYPFTPLYMTGGSYWLCLTTEQMNNFSSMINDCLTLGTEGVSSIAKIVNARFFLPYAHWWNVLGSPGGRNEEEIDLIIKLEQELKNHGCQTAIVPWKIGDGYVTRGIRDFYITKLY